MVNGYQSLNSSNSKANNSNVNFTSYTIELEEEINETRKELNFLKKEVAILNTEKETVAEMATTKCEDIDRYLNKEIHYLEELINRAQMK